FLFPNPAPTPLYTLSLHDALPISCIRFLSDQQFAFASGVAGLIYREKVATSFLFGYYYAESLIMAEVGNQVGAIQVAGTVQTTRSEEHTSELQSRGHLVCRLLLEK